VGRRAATAGLRQAGAVAAGAGGAGETAVDADGGSPPTPVRSRVTELWRGLDTGMALASNSGCSGCDGRYRPRGKQPERKGSKTYLSLGSG